MMTLRPDQERSWSLDSPAAEDDRYRCRPIVFGSCDLVAEHRGFCAACGAPPKPTRRDELELWQILSLIPLWHIALAMRRDELLHWADDERKLRLVALALGFKRGWAWHRQIERQRGVA
jgi:DNA repair protein RadD